MAVPVALERREQLVHFGFSQMLADTIGCVWLARRGHWSQNSAFDQLEVTRFHWHCPHVQTGHWSQYEIFCEQCQCRPAVQTRSNSYLRLYKRGDVLKRHRDRTACEISLSLNIGQRTAEPWPSASKASANLSVHRCCRETPCCIGASIYSIGVRSTKARRWSRYSCIMSIATDRMLTRNSTVG